MQELHVVSMATHPIAAALKESQTLGSAMIYFDEVNGMVQF
jgi:hypothetical protein